MGRPGFLDVDFSLLPRPEDDGAAAHLTGTGLPAVALAATDCTRIDLASQPGRLVVYAYPLTGRPGSHLPDGWDAIPGARGCTPESCGCRDHFTKIEDAGVALVFALSTQDTPYQGEWCSGWNCLFRFSQTLLCNWPGRCGCRRWRLTAKRS